MNNFKLKSYHFDFNLKSNMPTNDLNWQIKLRKEETLIQQIAVVYDSIGLGKGQYRYDSTYNSYIPDQNGSYISYNILVINRGVKWVKSIRIN